MALEDVCPACLPGSRDFKHAEHAVQMRAIRDPDDKKWIPDTKKLQGAKRQEFLSSGTRSQRLRGRSALFYNDFSKDWLMRLKYGDQTQMAKKMAYWMVKCDPDFFKDIDCIVPVPIHFWRLLKRRYNQSALIANHISRLWSKPVVHSVLCKIKPTPSQGDKKRKERQDNVKDSFAVKDKSLIAGKHILLIDDVLTTGATLAECNRILYEAGAASVKYLAFAYRAEGNSMQ